MVYRHCAYIWKNCDLIFDLMSLSLIMIPGRNTVTIRMLKTKKTLSIPKMFPAILFHSNSPDLFKLISARKNENTLYRWWVDFVKYTCIAFLSIIHVVKRSALIMFTSKIFVFYVTKYLLYFKIWQSTCE